MVRCTNTTGEHYWLPTRPGMRRCWYCHAADGGVAMPLLWEGDQA